LFPWRQFSWSRKVIRVFHFREKNGIEKWLAFQYLFGQGIVELENGTRGWLEGEGLLSTGN
jgi:hypothetical protein